MRFRAVAVLLLGGVAAAGGQTAAKPPGRAEPLPSIADRTRGLERRGGFVPFYWDERKGELLLEIPGREEFLYGVGLSGGAGTIEVGLDRGQMGNLGVCRFERVGPRVLLVQRQTTHASGGNDPEQARVVAESFPTSVLASLPIAAQEGDRVLADATAFLLADTEVLPALKAARAGDWRQDTARSALRLERTGAFPRNTEIEVLQTFVSENPAVGFASVLPDGRTMSLTVHHTFLALPERGYRPRAFDPRIGFIPLRRLDHTAPFTEPIE